MKIGVVGLGPMGSRMAMRLLDAGHSVSVWNRTGGKADALVERGAMEADTPAEACDQAGLVLTMVANDAAMRAVVLGEDGVADGLGREAVHIACSTMSVALAREMEAAHGKRGQGFVSATVLGRPPAVEAGQLFVMLAGAEAARGKAMPALEALGQRVFVVGDEAWKANLVKLCANFMIFSTIEQLSEVFAVSEKAGVPAETVFEVLSNSFCSAPIHKNYGRLILDGVFSPPGGPMVLGKKDNDLFLEAGEMFGAALPMASLIRDRFITSMARGDGELDFAALSRRAREDAGL
jgi:3-hydroxyisobutyrate dehydrogenase-like beta-hydroxyacid dehydrogenase